MASPPPKPSFDFSFSGVTLAAQTFAPLAEEKAVTLPPASSVYTLPSATSGTALKRPLDDEPVPASADHTLRSWSPRARWPRLFEGEPPGCDHDALACGEGSWTGLPASAGSIATMFGSVMTATRSPGSLASSLRNGFSSVRLSEFNPSLLPQPARLTAKAARSPAPIRLMPFPRVMPERNFEPPLRFTRYFDVVLSACGVPTISASIISARSRKFGGVP